MQPLTDRIVALLAGASAQAPARAPDILKLTGAAEDEFWPALEALMSAGVLASALVKRQSDAHPWLGIWPAGQVRKLGHAGGSFHRSLFVRHQPLRWRLRDASAPRIRSH
ncbi:MAG: hypothetical protein ACK4KV_19165 [Rhodocyclaceae bacterium]